MKRPLRRLHLVYWLILVPVLLSLIAYALTRPQNSPQISDDNLFTAVKGEPL